MRVLLISANTERLNLATLPLGLAQVAAATEHAGHETSLLNLMLEAKPHEALARAIDDGRPDAIGISVRNVDDQNMEAPHFFLGAVRDVVRACRDRSGAPIVVGGAGYSIFPRAALDYLEADYGVCGDGERAFPALLSRLASGNPAEGQPLPAGGRVFHRRSRGVPGVTKGDAVVEIPSAESRTPDLDAFPLPDPARWLEGVPRDFWVPVQSRRGCPLDCTYCSTAAIEGRAVRRRSPARVAEDVARTREAGFRHFYFVDSTFNLPESYALALCREISRRPLDIEWRCIIYPRGISDGLAAAMREAGCVEASVGFEAGSASMLRALNKRFTPDDVRVTCARLAAHGIRRNGFLLLGGPGETSQTVQASLAFAESLRLDALKITRGIRIYPNTSLHATAVAEGVVAADDSLLFPRFYQAPGFGTLP